MSKALANDCGLHKPCQSIQDGDAACCCWVAYIGGGVRIDAKSGVNGGSTMAGPGVATRACCYERRCSAPPLLSWTKVHVDGPSPRRWAGLGLLP
jgi:hypothetical protein